MRALILTLVLTASGFAQVGPLGDPGNTGRGLEAYPARAIREPSAGPGDDAPVIDETRGPGARPNDLRPLPGDELVPDEALGDPRDRFRLPPLTYEGRRAFGYLRSYEDSRFDPPDPWDRSVAGDRGFYPTAGEGPIGNTRRPADRFRKPELPAPTRYYQGRYRFDLADERDTQEARKAPWFNRGSFGKRRGAPRTEPDLGGRTQGFYRNEHLDGYAPPALPRRLHPTR
jgi:hypothetical protein